MTHPLASIALGLIRHKRLKPASHHFSYSGLFVRLPMVTGFKDEGFWFRRNRLALLSFFDCDHGNGAAESLGWIQQVLATFKVMDADGEIWLHTFPRMFGYVFKPVSFWYCERSDGTLRAVLVEVNNTFGERHCYLLENPDGSPIRAGQTLHSGKVFHVSPFNPVEGHYQFRFLVRNDRSLACIDYFDAEGCVLQTSMSGQHTPLSAKSVGQSLLRTPWFTIGVVLRIHWQALKLWLKKVPFYSKPIPPVQQVSAASTRKPYSSCSVSKENLS